MKKVFKIEALDCANCAAKMETAISKIDGVDSVNISFIAQKLTLAADDALFEDVLKKAIKTIKRIDSGCKVIVLG